MGFPGAAPGRLRPWDRWRLIEKATMAYGYGLSVSLLQVARAYTVFARNGDMVSLTLVKRDSDPTSVKIYTPKTTALVRGMLEAAAGPEGTKAAQVQGYRVAGKSGTARKIVDGKYSMQRYRSSYVGFAPVSDPKIVVAVSIDEPTVGGYYGGAIAAPVFSHIVGGSLRLMGCGRTRPSNRQLLLVSRSQADERQGLPLIPAATVEQAVAWLHSRVSLTAHLKLDSREIEPGDVFVACRACPATAVYI